MKSRTVAAAGCAAVVALAAWHFFVSGPSAVDRGVAAEALESAIAASPSATPTSDAIAPPTTAGSGPATSGAKATQGSLWIRRPPADAARRAFAKELERRYRRLGASRQFIDQMANGDMVGALNDLKKQALSGDPAAISAYGSFAYENCIGHRRTDSMDSYSQRQMSDAGALPPTDAQWFRETYAATLSLEKAVVAACDETVDVDQALDLIHRSAKQSNATGLYLSSRTATTMTDMQQQLRGAAMLGSADAQLQIAFTVLGGHQKELLGTGPDALNVGDLLRQSAEQIPQAEGNLAICEFYGCGGIAADPATGIQTALSAAEHGDIAALLAIAPHLSPSQLDPTVIEAWTLMQAATDLQCGGSWSDAKAMKATLDTLSSPAATPAARQRAEQLWAQYGPQLGC